MNGLKKAGIEIIECRDDGSRFAKYLNLWKKHEIIKNDYDAMIVGYGGHVIVPFAKLISKKPIIADLLGSFKDAEEHSHNAGFFRRLKDGLIDWLAVECANAVLLESNSQREFFVNKYSDLKKLKVLYTGLDETVFHCDNKFNDNKSTKDNSKKIVLFRGRLTPESGIFHILSAAELLKDKRPDITFRIIGFHYRLGQRVKDFIKEKDLSNVELIYDYISDDLLREKMCETSIALGQFESNPRLDRTIPHKIFEAMSMGLPIITAESKAVKELLTNNESCLFVKRADPSDLVEKIITIVDDSNLGMRLAMNAQKVYKEKVSTEVLIKKLIGIIKEQI
ncbi:MAG: glycosyltransferase family 4 protein [Candidatus Paceibacterota bacterium]|jgi:glycosyltransferase involved in cell wall biosynthesis